MENGAYTAMINRSMDPQVSERTVAYLTEHLGQFLRKNEQVLICFPEHKSGNLSWLMEQAVLRCGACPVVWGADRRWKALLQLAFYRKATAIIGAPLIVLGLTKLKKAYSLPLYIRLVITAGYPCLNWMIDGIVQGLDCEMGGCFSLGVSGVVAGFACGHSWGVHLWEEEYGVDIVDSSGQRLPEGEMGEILLYPREQPELRCVMDSMARLDRTSCECGCSAVRLVDFRPGASTDPDLFALGQELQSWTSVLDCRLNKGECGLEIEAIVFPGEKLPKLPAAAKRVLHPFDPEHDEPYWYVPRVKGMRKGKCDI